MQIEDVLNTQKEYFLSKKTFSIEFRISVLKKLRKLFFKYQKNYVEAFKLDFNKCEFDVLSTEFNLVVQEIDFMIKHIKSLSKTKKVKTSIINFPSKGLIYKEPYGLVLIIAPWNYPLLLTMQPVIGAIAAGNCVIIKPSEYSENVSKVIFEMIEELNMPELLKVILGGREISEYLLNQRFDYIFFTGGEKVGKIVLEKASKYLTPVTLELGGKSPCIVDFDADLDITCRRIVWGKYVNAGQTCVAPDYVCIHNSIKEKFIEKIIKTIKEFYYKDDKVINEFPYIINYPHLNRLLNLIDRSKIIFGGKNENLLLEPTIIDNVNFNDKIMQEEIFGPLMPIITFNNIDELIRIIQLREKPLALYYFSSNLNKAKKVMRMFSFGGGCINDTIMHLTNENLPFGGIGNSGMGSYHGKKSFETFTHEKSVLVKSNLEVKLKYPPYSNKKLKLLKKMYKDK